MIPPWDKLFVVTRADLGPGHQAAQSFHAGLEFARERPEECAAWQSRSNTVALLAADDERALALLAARARDAGASVTCWREPDRGGELTAVVLGPGRSSQRLCRGLSWRGKRW